MLLKLGRLPNFSEGKPKVFTSYFLLSATATATATVAPTMGLLPIENPEISLFYFGSKVQILHHFSIFIKQSSVLIVSHFI